MSLRTRLGSSDGNQDTDKLQNPEYGTIAARQQASLMAAGQQLLHDASCLLHNARCLMYYACCKVHNAISTASLVQLTRLVLVEFYFLLQPLYELKAKQFCIMLSHSNSIISSQHYLIRDPRMRILYTNLRTDSLPILRYQSYYYFFSILPILASKPQHK